MGRVSKYADELRERAVRMVAEVRRSTPRSGRRSPRRGHVGDRHTGDVAHLDPPLGGRYRPAPGCDHCSRKVILSTMVV